MCLEAIAETHRAKLLVSGCCFLARETTTSISSG